MKNFLKISTVSILLLSSLTNQPILAEESQILKGEIEFYTSQPDADAAKLVESYNSLYPEVKVNIFRSGTEEVMSKIKAEKESGKIVADILLLADAVTFESLKEDGILLEYKSKEAENIQESYVDPDGMYTGTKIMTTGIILTRIWLKKHQSHGRILTRQMSKNNWLCLIHCILVQQHTI
ncbi:type 2 periplasmic-binding domain-containing protein [Facklamia miroungae]|uniref:Iron(III) transport system substrate-binding protein n=1 Tax=Facklamia miroungae TaxID=120956 RepID=A0A1G7V699_9LACT|nr:hypothetical protein [Facklamia miroungae]SDG54480.1 iron(III) transport system substrate-binding protein [Facklamia miroungae]